MPLIVRRDIQAERPVYRATPFEHDQTAEARQRSFEASTGVVVTRSSVVSTPALVRTTAGPSIRSGANGGSGED